MSVTRFALIVGSLLITGESFAQQIELPDWDNSVEFRLVASQQPVRPGDSFEIALLADIEEGYHLYGPEEPEPSRTAISVVGEQVETGTPSFPPVESRDLAGLGTYDLYEGSIAIKVPMSVNETSTTDEHTLLATVNYQVCTDFACSAPTWVELSITVPGGAAGADAKQLHPEIFKQK